MGEDQGFYVQKIEAALDQLGERRTRPRHLMAQRLGFLAASGQGFTGDELWLSLRGDNPTLGRATVFRTVRRLVEVQVVDLIDFLDGTKLYRVCGEVLNALGHHHHLACLRCHSIREFSFCLPQDQLEAVSRDNHFDVQAHSLTLYGVCENCQLSTQPTAPLGAPEPPPSGSADPPATLA
ncbi:MAG: transcriptional repressor [Spirochaetales bacterium]|nr:transcriptional repressor [Spirochaetales bacterium]